MLINWPKPERAIYSDEAPGSKVLDGFAALAQFQQLHREQKLLDCDSSLWSTSDRRVVGPTPGPCGPAVGPGGGSDGPGTIRVGERRLVPVRSRWEM